MNFSHSFLGVQFNISLTADRSSSSSAKATPKSSAANSLSAVRLNDDCVEFDVSNFTGTIVIHREGSKEEVDAARKSGAGTEVGGAVGDGDGATDKVVQTAVEDDPEIVVDAFPEESGFVSGHPPHHLFPSQSWGGNSMGQSIRTNSSKRGRFNSFSTLNSFGRTSIGNRFSNNTSNNVPSNVSNGSKVANDAFNFHLQCSSPEPNIHQLRRMLQSNPALASISDQHGNYPAHTFGNNEYFVFNHQFRGEVGDFVRELFQAYPDAFYNDNVYEIPFVGFILEWIEGYCQPNHDIDQPVRGLTMSNPKDITLRLMENSTMSVEEDIKSLRLLSSKIFASPKLVYSIQMFSLVLDQITESAEGDTDLIFSEGRETMIKNLATIPYFLRLLLLIDDAEERYAVLHSSLIQNVLFCKDSVGSWMVAMICGTKHAKESFVLYLKIISKITLPTLLDMERKWNQSDLDRFRQLQQDLFAAISELDMILPTMIQLGDTLLQEAAPTKAAVYVIDEVLGNFFAVTVTFLDLMLQLALMITFRVILHLVYSPTVSTFSEEFRPFWILAFAITLFFLLRDLSTAIATVLTSRYAVKGLRKSMWNFISWATIWTTLIYLTILRFDRDYNGPYFTAVIMWLMWMKLIGHIKGMSEHVALLLYTILRIVRKIIPFIVVSQIIMFLFGDLIIIISKSSGRCDSATYSDDDYENEFCSASSMDSYIFMYTLMMSGPEYSTLYYSSGIVVFLLIVYLFLQVVVMMNILIAIVTYEYEATCDRSRILFERSRLEMAARHDARARFLDRPLHGVRSADGTNFFCPSLPSTRESASNNLYIITRSLIKIGMVVVGTGIEIFLVQTISTGFSLSRKGILQYPLTVALLVCAILINIAVASVVVLQIAYSSRNVGCIVRLKEKKWFLSCARFILSPLRLYLRAIGVERDEIDETFR